MRDWASVAGRGRLLLSGSVAHASLKTAVGLEFNRFNHPCPLDIELGDGLASKPRIYMPICKGPCKDIVVNVAAAEGSIYIMYREYMSKVGADYKMMPIIVIYYFKIIHQFATYFFIEPHSFIDKLQHD